MEYYKPIKLKDGRTCIIRNCTVKDSRAVLEVFSLTHEQTDRMLTYPEEMSFTVEQEAEFLQGRNPLGFRTREGRWQELVLMRLVLSGGNKE